MISVGHISQHVYSDDSARKESEEKMTDFFFSLLKTLKTAQNKIDQFHHITSARWRKVFSEKYQYKRASTVGSER